MSRLLIAIFFVAASVLLGVLYVRPEWQRFRAFSQEIAGLEEISGEFDALISNRDKLLGIVNSVSKEDLARLDQMLPQGPRTSDFLTALEALAAENGVSLRRIDLVAPDTEKAESSYARPPAGALSPQPRPTAGAGAGRDKGEVEALPFSIQVSGSYSAFKKFLGALERSLRLIDVEEISFSAERGDNMEFSLKAKTYYQ